MLQNHLLLFSYSYLFILSNGSAKIVCKSTLLNQVGRYKRIHVRVYLIPICNWDVNYIGRAWSWSSPLYLPWLQDICDKYDSLSLSDFIGSNRGNKRKASEIFVFTIALQLLKWRLHDILIPMTWLWSNNNRFATHLTLYCLLLDARSL